MSLLGEPGRLRPSHLQFVHAPTSAEGDCKTHADVNELELIRQTAVFELSGVFGLEPGNTVYTRINRVATPWRGWHVIGTGDYSGRSDILFQNSSGAVDIWEMRGTSRQQ